MGGYRHAREHEATGAGRLCGGLGLLALSVLLALACAAKKPANVTKPAEAGAKAPLVPAAARVAPVPAAAPATAPAAAAPGPAAPAAPAPAPLVGHVTRADLETYAPWKDLRAQDYVPDSAAVAAIAQRGAGVTVLAIVGTWCRDSKREVPRFFKIADQAGLRLDAVTLVAVDRSKKDVEGLTDKHAITRVPTFVFFRGGTEVGRVTEKAATTLENDIATILSK